MKRPYAPGQPGCRLCSDQERTTRPPMNRVVSFWGPCSFSHVPAHEPTRVPGTYIPLATPESLSIKCDPVGGKRGPVFDQLLHRSIDCASRAVPLLLALLFVLAASPARPANSLNPFSPSFDQSFRLLRNAYKILLAESTV